MCEEKRLEGSITLPAAGEMRLTRDASPSGNQMASWPKKSGHLGENPREEFDRALLLPPLVASARRQHSNNESSVAAAAGCERVHNWICNTLIADVIAVAKLMRRRCSNRVDFWFPRLIKSFCLIRCRNRNLMVLWWRASDKRTCLMQLAFLGFYCVSSRGRERCFVCGNFDCPCLQVRGF